MQLSDTLLVVFCRQPRIGVGKQRLAGDIGAAAAELVAAQLWSCVLEDLVLWPGPVVVAVAEQAELRWGREQLRVLRHHVSVTNRRRDLQVCLQPDGNLGERLNEIDAQLRARGHEHLVFIGSDAPALDCQRIEQLALQLRDYDAVLAAAEDGGVVTMASRRPWPELRELSWSTALLGAELADCCRGAGFSVLEAEGTFDIDDLKSLRRAGIQLRDDARHARRQLAALADRLAMDPLE